MKKALLFSTLLFVSAACSRNNDVAPTLASEVAGTYLTNGFLDILCIALPANQMPAVTLTPETEAAVTLTYLRQYPTAQSQTLTHLQLTRLADKSIQLTQQGQVLGTVQTDRAFNTNGMERQALVLRVQTNANPQTAITFTGAKE
ncbi:hypothetical protein [Fibrella forsythiae]|uniref:Lipoprotein n=1 Tax=Fibrella forsythiae TaxID=2817061 RepID=A0ABS3JJP5_9BACT|nr:hypothetical protein [Fibrella forsythiae]MBO0950224.1 hypothetical protein [Fibrella forsythiae]